MSEGPHLETPSEVVDAFITAVGTALREMAGVEAFAKSVHPAGNEDAFADLSAVLKLTAGAEGCFVLSVPNRVAETLARRILTEVVPDPDPSMIRDCLGEVTNVIAGQAKSLLAGTQYHFRFATPTVVEGRPADVGARDWLVEFASDVGDFTFHMCLND